MSARKSVMSKHSKTIKNWKDYVEVDGERSKTLKGPSGDKNYPLEAYKCKFCSHLFTYNPRNGPRTISKHLEKCHQSDMTSTTRANSSPQNVPVSVGELDIRQYQPPGPSTTSELDFVIKIAARQWRSHVTVEDLRLSKADFLESKYTQERFNCKYCSKLFGYSSRNGPGTIVKHLEKHHLPEVLRQHPQIFQALQQQPKNLVGYQGKAKAADAIQELGLISKTVKKWRHHFTKNEQKTYELKLVDSSSVGFKEVYDCNYCLESKIYNSRNGPKTMSNHLEKSHKKELLTSTNTRKRPLSLGSPVSLTDSIFEYGALSENTTSSGGSKKQKISQASDYTNSKFHEDVIKFLNENKLYISVVKSSSFKNLIGNLRPEYLDALDELNSLYSSFLQLVANSNEATDINLIPAALEKSTPPQ